jgi:O-antigen/teichoic acid export membrane protein
MVAEPSADAGSIISHGRVARNAVTYLAGQLLSWSVTFVTVSIIPRRLGETGMGQLAVAGAVVGTVSSIYSLSVEQYLMTEVGRDRTQTERLLRALWGLRLAAFIPMALCVLAVLRLVHADPTVTLLGALGAFGALITYLNAPARSVLAGWEEAKRVSAFDIAGACGPLLAIPFLAHGPVALALAGLVMSLGVFTVAAGHLRKRMRVAPTFAPAAWRRLAAGGVPFLMNDTVTQFYGFGSVFLLRHFAGEASVGEYNQAMKLQGTFMFVPVALGTALLPSLARLADADASRFRDMQGRVLALVLVLALPVTTMVMLLAHPLCRLLYGPTKFANVPGALQTSALNLIPLYINTMMYRFLVAQRKNLVWSFFMVGTVGLNALFCVGLIPAAMRRGLGAPTGAVLASLIAEAITVVFAFALLRNNPLNRETVGKIMRSVVATSAMAAAVWSTRSVFIVVPLALGLGVYALAACQLRVLGEDEHERLRQLVRGRIGRRRDA